MGLMLGRLYMGKVILSDRAGAFPNGTKYHDSD